MNRPGCSFGRPSRARGAIGFRIRAIVPVVALVIAATLSGCGESASTFQGGSQPLLSYSSKTRTVQLQLLAGENSDNNGLNFDGAANGSMTVTVPVGWEVDVNCANYSTVLSHSCAIISWRTTRPAFAGAEIANATEGLEAARNAQFSFRASVLGRYRIVSLAAGQLDEGMWDRFTVRKGGRPALVGAIPVSLGS
jgi:Sulfocyanin (SoxE) domain